MINEIPDLLTSDAHFHLSGFTNKQNFCYWSSEKPQRVHEKLLHSAKLPVWCAISSFEIVGPYFFENSDGRIVTVNSQRYVSMFENFLGPKLAHHPVNEDTNFFNKMMLQATPQGFPLML
jgi:hypothetical protein